jgi:hypothetical protein
MNFLPIVQIVIRINLLLSINIIALVMTVFKKLISIWSQFLIVVILYKMRKWKRKLKFFKMALIPKTVTAVTVIRKSLRMQRRPPHAL